MADETASTDGLQKPHLFQPGQSGNPAGRTKGTRNKLGEAFIEALHDDFAKNGVTAIQTVRAEKPDQYLKVIASLLPKDVNLNVNNMDDLTDDELIQRIRDLSRAAQPFLAAEGFGGIAEGTGAAQDHAGRTAKPSRVQ